MPKTCPGWSRSGREPHVRGQGALVTCATAPGITGNRATVTLSLLVNLVDEYRTAMEAPGMRHNTLRSMGTVRTVLAEFALKMPKALTLAS